MGEAEWTRGGPEQDFYRSWNDLDTFFWAPRLGIAICFWLVSRSLFYCVQSRDFDACFALEKYCKTQHFKETRFL